MKTSTFFYLYAPSKEEKIPECTTILYYHGPLNSLIIADMLKSLRTKVETFKNIGWKIHAIFAEMVQNVYYYSDEHTINDKNEPIGATIIKELEDCFQVTTANMISAKIISKLEERCEAINNMNPSDLRVFKNNLLQSSLESNRKGANIGLTQIALLSKEKLQYELEGLTEERAFFSITSTIKKNNT